MLLLLVTSAASARTTGMDTSANSGDLPFSINGTQVMDMTTGGLNISGTVTATGVTINGAAFVNGYVQATTNSAASAITGISNTSGAAIYGNNPSGAGWAGVFTGAQYGVYGVGSVWAGLFSGPVQVNGGFNVTGAMNAYSTISASGNVYAPNFSGTSPDGRASFAGVNNANGWTGVFNGNLYGVYASGANWAGIFAGPMLVTGQAYLQSNVSITGDTSVGGNLYVTGKIVSTGRSNYYAGIWGGTLQAYHSACNLQANPFMSVWNACVAACNRFCGAQGYSGGTMVEENGPANVADCLCSP